MDRHGERAFESDRGGMGGDVYATGLDGAGTGLRNPTACPDADDRKPAWSPDGEWIPFASDHQDDLDLYLVRPDGTGMTRLTVAEGTDSRPVWRPKPRS